MKKQITLSLIVLNIFFCIQNIAYGQEAVIHESIQLETDKIFDKVVEIRRDLHKYPELSGKEKRTQEVIKKHLLSLGLRVETDIYGYAIVGILEGKKDGKKIGWRADMDALPDDFPDNVDFKSTIKGVKHSCGHDVHTAIGLGIAEVMVKHKNSLQGTIYFIFQPEEETFTGAKGMVENNFFTKFKMDEIYGLHVAPLQVGQIMTKPNELFAYQKEVRIELKNTLSEKDVNELATKIRQSLARTKNGGNPSDLHLVTDPEIGLLSQNTIFTDFLIVENLRVFPEKDKLCINAFIFETDSARLKNIIPTIEQVIEDQNYSSQLLSVSFISGNPTVLNHPKLTNSSIHILENIYGKELVTAFYGQLPYSNEDFAYFQQKIPGVLFVLGASNFEKGVIAMPHTPNFGVDEECIRIAVRSFSSLIFERFR